MAVPTVLKARKIPAATGHHSLEWRNEREYRFSSHWTPGGLESRRQSKTGCARQGWSLPPLVPTPDDVLAGWSGDVPYGPSAMQGPIYPARTVPVSEEKSWLY